MERSDRLHQSVDLAIQEALVEHEDPLALSFYLWIIKKNRHSFVNLSNLTSWGVAHVRRIFVDRLIGRRRDEEIASAALVATALIDAPELATMRKAVCTGIAALLREESDSGNLIPLKRPAYGTLLLNAAQLMRVDEKLWRSAAKRTVAAFVEAVSGGRLFGLIFASQLAEAIDDHELANALESAAVESLDADAVDFEDHIYLLEALWELTAHKTRPGDSLMSVTAEVLKKAPVWQYMMNGDEHVPPAGDGRTAVYMSHLYRAALLDVVLRYQAHHTSYQQEQVDKRYRERSSLSQAAFGFYVLSLLLIWGITGYYLVTRAGLARRYWILSDFAAMTSFAALLYLAVVLGAIYLLIITVMVMPKMYAVLIRAQIGSDQRMRDLVRPRLWNATKLWFGLVVLAILFGVMTNLIAPAIKHLFNLSVVDQ